MWYSWLMSGKKTTTVPKQEPIKYTAFKDVKMYVSNDPEKYTARRTYWLLLSYSKKLERDPTSVKVEDYLKLLDKWEVLQKNLNKKRGKRAIDAGVDAREVAEDRLEDVSSILG